MAFLLDGVVALHGSQAKRRRASRVHWHRVAALTLNLALWAALIAGFRLLLGATR